MEKSEKEQLKGLENSVREELKKILENASQNNIPLYQASIDNDNKNKIENILGNKLFKKKLCAKLQSFSGDIWDLSKIVVAVVFSLFVTGQLPLAASSLPVLIAYIILVIYYRIILADYCAK